MFAGPNGSGKSCLKSVVNAKWLGVYINADEIEKSLRSEGGISLSSFKVDLPDKTFLEGFEVICRKRKNSGETPQISCVKGLVTVNRKVLNSYHAAMIAELIRYYLLQKKISFTFETVMSHLSKVAFLKNAKEKGFKTYLYFIATEDSKINVARVESRVKNGGHDVPVEKIISRYSRAIELLPKALHVADRGYVFDNSGIRHLLIAETYNGPDNAPTVLELKVDELPAWMEKVIDIS